MIDLRTDGNIFEVGVQAIVNPINCVGTMGAGLALEFKNRYPQMFRFYKEACDKKEIKTGQIWVWRDRRLEKITLPDGQVIIEPEWIMNFPTKQHWQKPSKLEWIESGLDDLRNRVTLNGIESIALPALGCGYGGLPFDQVKNLIYDKLNDLPVYVVLFEPQ